MQILNKQIINTENLNTIITYNICDFEIITTNYNENTILVNIYNEDCNIAAMCTFESNGKRYDYNVINNVRNIDDELLDYIMEQLNNEICNLEV